MVERIISTMAEVNPAGTAFLGVIDALFDLTKDSNVSNIEIAMGSYEVDEQGKDKLVDGQFSVALRGMKIRGMNKTVQEEIRKEIEAGPLCYLMILWTDRSRKDSPLGIMVFNPVTKQQQTTGLASLDKVQKSVIADYLQGLVKR